MAVNPLGKPGRAYRSSTSCRTPAAGFLVGGDGIEPPTSCL